MSQTVPSNSNIKDNDEQLSMQEAQSMQEDSQFFIAPSSNPQANMPLEFDEVEMLEEPKLVFPVKAASEQAQTKSPKVSPQIRYRQGGAWGDLPLRSKVVAIAAVLGIVPATALGLLNYNLQGGVLNNRLETAAEVSATTVNDQLALFMRERLGDIQVMAREDLFTDSTLRSNATFAQNTEALDRFVNSYSVYNSIAVFDVSGEPLGNSGGKTVGNHASRVYFQAALEEDGAIISQPIISKSSGIFSVYLAAPIKDKATGETVGVVRARIPVSEIEGLVAAAAASESQRQGGAVEYRLYSQTNELFADSNLESEELMATPQAITNQLPLEKEEAGENRRGQNTSGSLGEATNISFSTPQASVGYAPFAEWSDSFRAELPDLGWKTVATIDSEVISAQRRRLLQGLIFQALLSGGILSLVAGLLATRATRPLLKAVDAVQKIGNGKLDTRLPVQGQDELATLNRNLNQMAEQLQDFTNEQQSATARANWLMGLATDAGNLNEAEVNQRLAETTTKIREFLTTDRMVIYRLDATGQLTLAQESVDDAWPSAADLDLSKVKLAPSFTNAFEKGEAVVMGAIAEVTLPESYADLLEELNVQSELVVPLVDHNELSGLLVAQSCEQRRNWSESDINFVKQIAAQLSILEQIQEVQAARGLAEINAKQEKERIEELQRRVMQLLMEVDPVSRGDLTIRAKVTEDEIGTVADSYNATIESLRRIVGQVQGTVTQVVDTASGSGQAVLTLASGANQQTEEITGALGSIEQMALSIRQVATNAAQAEIAVQKATATVKQGDAAMDKTVEGIFAIRETVGEAAKKVKRLGESSQKISKVVNLISSFAEQTNLLALNASIEAAHAGEEGRGFAVVADEVRSLARQSAQATAEIEALVAEIQSETNQVSAAMESGTAQVVTGTQLVETARQNLTQIADVSEQIRGLVADIAQATGQQTAASEQVSTVMQDVVGIANQTSESVDQVSNSLAALVNLAQSLDESVGQFKVQ